MKTNKELKTYLIQILLITAVIISSSSVFAQGKTKWMAVGSLHNWYSEFGTEIEEGLSNDQQFGLRWPADHKYMDMQAAKGLWIGVKNFTDASQFGGESWLHKVVHIGPRVNGVNEFFPVEWKMVSKFPNPTVTVDGLDSYQLAAENDEINPDLPYDRMIYNEVNTQIGATIKRKIYQFGQEYHNNYIVHEVTIVNTGNVDDDDEIELNSTLEDLYIYYLYRWAISRNTRYHIGNSSGWGINTMCDVRGDGLGNDYGTSDEDLRANYAWHGRYPGFTAYDNLGAPIWTPLDLADGLLTETDTVGRLGSAQFAGVVTLHADKSTSDRSDDASQPSTTMYVGSDDSYTSNNDAFNPNKMSEEYNIMSSGHKVRHAYVVEPDGDFITSKADPALGTGGGHSNANGYGPYTIEHGDSIKIVWAEAASGLSWDQSIEIGAQYKNGTIGAAKKNEYVLSGRDSLFKTFRRALSNYNSGEGFTIPSSPYPPSVFNVNSGGDKITLSWEHTGDGPAISGFEIYRSKGDWDSTYHLIYTAAPSDTEYEDKDLIRGVDYYYHIVAVGLPSDNNGGGNTPAGVPLKSSKYYTQSYDPANLKRPAGETMSEIRIVPNPYVISADPNNMLFPARQNRLAFFDIPGQCTIKIYTELGELINTIEHTDGSGDEFWDLNTESNQLVVSGIYIAVITDTATGENHIEKFVVIR